MPFYQSKTFAKGIIVLVKFLLKKTTKKQNEYEVNPLYIHIFWRGCFMIFILQLFLF